MKREREVWPSTIALAKGREGGHFGLAPLGLPGRRCRSSDEMPPRPPFEFARFLAMGGRTTADGYMENSRETGPFSVPEKLLQVASAKTLLSPVNMLGKRGGPLSEGIRCCSFVAAEAAGVHTPISLEPTNCCSEPRLSWSRRPRSW